jgi:hypothetical protein
MGVHESQLGGDLVLAVGIEHRDPMKDRDRVPVATGLPARRLERAEVFVDLGVAADPPVGQGCDQEVDDAPRSIGAPDIVDRVV